jgi:DNA-binding XRE family transcriptional regulator
VTPPNLLVLPVHNVGTVLRTLRIAQGYTCDSLAAKIGVQVHTLRGWERDDYPPRIETLVKWAKVMGYDGVTVLWDAETPTVKLRPGMLVKAPPKGKRFGGAMRVKAITAYQSGVPVYKIAEDIGTTPKTVYTWLREAK